MNSSELRASLSGDEPPVETAVLLTALWWDAKGDWDQAHRIVQDESGADAAWVHAYLHRKEGDLPNAKYWYNRANRQPASNQLEDEWADIVDALS